MATKLATPGVYVEEKSSFGAGPSKYLISSYTYDNCHNLKT